MLTRRYRRCDHHVTVREDGFEYEGEIYRSLSAVAKVITGSHWNGYLFFKMPTPKEQAEGGKVSNA